MSKERRLILRDWQVRALIDGRLSQVRIPIADSWWRCLDPDDDDDRKAAQTMCPLGQPGNRLWVSETIAAGFREPYGTCVAYVAEPCGSDPVHPWAWNREVVSAAHMPRWASRFALEIAGVRVGRAKDASVGDVLALGYTQDVMDGNLRNANGQTQRDAWQEQHGKRAPWESNPWVWVVDFKKIRA